MSFLSGLTHQAGNVLSGGINAVDYITNGIAGVNPARTLANNITDPNITLQAQLSNPSGLGLSGSFQPVQRAATQASGTNSATTPAATTTNQNTGSGQYTANSSGSGVASAYDNQLNSINQWLADLQPAQQAQEGALNANFLQSRNALDTSQQRALQDLGTQQQQIQNNRARSLNDLATRGRNLIQSINNQLGTVGAGSSSASQVLAPYAIAQQQNQIGGDVNNQANQQIAAVDTSRNRLQDDYKTKVQQLEQDKQNKLLSVAQSFADISHQLQSQYQSASAAKQQALGAQYAQSVDQVNQIVQQLDAQYRAQLANINNFYANYQPAQQTLAPVDNNVQAINTAGFSNNNSAITPDTQGSIATALGVDPTKQDQNVLQV